jgi:transposase
VSYRKEKAPAPWPMPDNNLCKYGRKTEKAATIPGQYVIDFENMAVINEAELLVEAHGKDEPKPEKVLRNRPKHYQKKKEKLSGVPVQDVPAEEIPEAELNEIFPNGYERLKDEEYEELAIIPATLKIMRYHVAVYKSKPDKNGNVEFARGPRKGRLFGSDSLASPSLVAAVINGKYGNANPLNRLSNALLQKDLNLAPQNLAGWCIKAADRYFSPLYDLMHREMTSESKLIHADESYFKVTEDMKKKGPNTKSYMWLYHTDQRYGCHPIFLYEYCDNRNHENPERFLQDYHGGKEVPGTVKAVERHFIFS